MQAKGPGMWAAVAIAIGVSGTTGTAGDGYRLDPVPKTSVTLDDGFWGRWMEVNRTGVLPACLHQCEITGRLANFRRAGGLEVGEHEGYFFNDSDVYKIIEGASDILALHEDPELETALDRLIAEIAAAQEGDGYLNTYYTLAEPDQKWTNTRVRHELYCAGHLFEAAVAHHEATGKRDLLDVALKFAEHIEGRFGPDGDHRPPGHQQIEMGLVRLYHHTGEQRWLDLAEFFLEQRGRDEGRELYGAYAQDHLPVAEQDKAVGHAVRAAYMYAGMADVAAATGNEAYIATLKILWEDVTGTKLYITGAIGATRAGEAFGEDYDLPNESAYAETCAAIANALWNQRMLRLEGDAKYADVIERVIYNGFLVGVSLEGDRFFYPNPLTTDGVTPFNHGSAERAEWFACACCPSNDVRFFPRILSYLYATSGDRSLYVNQFAAGEANVRLGERDVKISQETQYPWNGTVRLSLEPEREAEFSVFVRIPGWARGEPLPGGLYRYMDTFDGEPVLLVNGEQTPVELDRGYVRIDRAWSPGDTITLELPMPPRRVAAHENVEANRGRIAIERGPIVYAIEGHDHGGNALDIALPDGGALWTQWRGDLLGGVMTVSGEGVRRRYDLEDREVRDERVQVTAIPYYAWNNRGATEMTIWMPRDPAMVELPPEPTIASTARVRVSHCWSSDTPAAINDLREPASSADQSIPRHTWWSRRGTTEWAELHFTQPVEISETGVYWFDDTGVGHCRVPHRWRVFYRDGEEWMPLPGGGELEAKADAFNRFSFEPIRTDALRIEADLRENFSGGILEWKVE